MLALLDMDGVLTDFPRAMCQAHGLPVRNEWLSPENTGLSVKDFWEPCNHESFWQEMYWMPDGYRILEAVEHAFEKVFILTAPTLSSQSYSGKIEWVKLNLPRYLRKTIICPSSPKDELNKAFVAKPDRVLIDDTDRNVDAFVEAGGQGILVPRPWNTLSWSHTDRLIEGLKA